MKNIFFILTLLVLSLTLTACSTDDSQVPSSADATQVESSNSNTDNADATSTKSPKVNDSLQQLPRSEDYKQMAEIINSLEVSRCSSIKFPELVEQCKIQIEATLN